MGGLFLCDLLVLLLDSLMTMSLPAIEDWLPWFSRSLTPNKSGMNVIYWPWSEVLLILVTVQDHSHCDCSPDISFSIAWRHHIPFFDLLETNIFKEQKRNITNSHS